MKIKYYKYIIYILVTLISSVHVLFADNDSSKDERLRIVWDEVEGAVKYEIQIRDSSDSFVLKKVVDSNYIDFSLSPGKYTIRIGALNKFQKVGSWSDWESIEIKRTLAAKIFRKEKSYAGQKGIRIAAGPNYFKIQSSSWSSNYENSFTGAAFYSGYSFWFFRFAGIEFDLGYVKFGGIDQQNKAETNISCIIGGFGLYGTTNFKFPLNLYIRAGGGIVNTTMEHSIKKGTAVESGSLVSRDPYYKAGLSLEFRISRSFFIESGMDYVVIRYLVEDMASFRYFFLAGMRL